MRVFRVREKSVKVHCKKFFGRRVIHRSCGEQIRRALLASVINSGIAISRGRLAVRTVSAVEQIPCSPAEVNSPSMQAMTSSLPRPEVIITHESDLDGLVSGILLHRLDRKMFNSDVRLEAYHYNNWRQRELREKSGWVSDLTFEARLDKENL